MSRPSQHTVKCGGCGRDQDFTAWDSVNVTLDPGLKQKLLEGELTRFTCESCGWSAEVDYPLLYHDMEKRMMIWFLPDGEPGDVPVPKGMRGHRLRAVATRNDLMEKVAIFDAGLDDRVMEFFKLWMRAQASESQPIRGELYFAGTVDKEDGSRAMRFEHWTEGEPKVVSVGLDALHATADALKDRFPPPEAEGGKWLRIDANYVTGLLSGQAGE